MYTHLVTHTSVLLSYFIFYIISFLPHVEAQGNPEVVYTTFRNFPSRFFFFDDTSTAIMFDSSEGIVYVTEDEGRSWEEASGIPKGEAAMVIEHPFDNQYVSKKLYAFRT